jgi:hypothetical protein
MVQAYIFTVLAGVYIAAATTVPKSKKTTQPPIANSTASNTSS